VLQDHFKLEAFLINGRAHRASYAEPKYCYTGRAIVAYKCKNVAISLHHCSNNFRDLIARKYLQFRRLIRAISDGLVAVI